eukprot:jgi/Mesvir1/21864/Mv04241-RA.1
MGTASSPAPGDDELQEKLMRALTWELRKKGQIIDQLRQQLQNNGIEVSKPAKHRESEHSVGGSVEAADEHLRDALAKVAALTHAIDAKDRELLHLRGQLALSHQEDCPCHTRDSRVWTERDVAAIRHHARSLQQTIDRLNDHIDSLNADKACLNDQVAALEARKGQMQAILNHTRAQHEDTLERLELALATLLEHFAEEARVAEEEKLRLIAEHEAAAAAAAAAAREAHAGEMARERKEREEEVAATRKAGEEAVEALRAEHGERVAKMQAEMDAAAAAHAQAAAALQEEITQLLAELKRKTSASGAQEKVLADTTLQLADVTAHLADVTAELAEAREKGKALEVKVVEKDVVVLEKAQLAGELAVAKEQLQAAAKQVAEAQIKAEALERQLVEARSHAAVAQEVAAAAAVTADERRTWERELASSRSTAEIAVERARRAEDALELAKLEAIKSKQAKAEAESELERERQKPLKQIRAEREAKKTQDAKDAKEGLTPRVMKTALVVPPPRTGCCTYTLQPYIRLLACAGCLSDPGLIDKVEAVSPFRTRKWNCVGRVAFGSGLFAAGNWHDFPARRGADLAARQVALATALAPMYRHAGMATRKFERYQPRPLGGSGMSVKSSGKSSSSRVLYIALLGTLVAAFGLYYWGLIGEPASKIEKQTSREDYDMIRATNSDRDRFKKDVAVEYIDYCKRRGLPAPSALEALEEPVEPKLSDPRYFDAYSYAQFKVAARYVRDPKARHRITQRMGRRLLEMVLALAQRTPSGDADDREMIQDLADTVLKTFKAWGYISDGGIIWPKTIAEDWEDGQAKFQYWMADPVILPSAQALYAEENFAQHFSSRTLEALFMTFGIVAHESDDFDPREFSKDRIVEQWTLTIL